MVNKMENINDVTMEKNYSVYMHVCPNGKRYIGITRQIPNVRWQNGKGYKQNKHFYSAIQKYGWENIVHIVIENNLTLDDANKMEIELIAKFKSADREYGYNIDNGGNGIGRASKETRKKISNNHANVKCEKNPMYGKKHSLETRKKISNVHKGRKLTNEHKEKIKNSSRHIGGGEHSQAKKVYCDKIVFTYIQQCANYYSINVSTMTSWLSGKNKMNSDFQQLGLRIATNDDLNKYEIYDAKKHGDKYSVVINVTNKGCSKSIHCNNLIFNSITDCANYYSIKISTMTSWLKGTRKMPLDFQKLNLRYATNEDLDTYPRYTPVNN